MYYKIENKNSQVYRELRKMRKKEINNEKNNLKAVNKKIKLDYTHSYGVFGQQNHNRCTSFLGFAFGEPDKVCLKTWTKSKDDESIFIPNTKTKEGMEMLFFLGSKLKHSWWETPLKILGINAEKTAIFPYVEICGDKIVLFLDDKQQPKDPNVIEITQKEFEDIRKVLKGPRI